QGPAFHQARPDLLPQSADLSPARFAAPALQPVPLRAEARRLSLSELGRNSRFERVALSRRRPRREIVRAYRPSGEGRATAAATHDGPSVAGAGAEKPCLSGAVEGRRTGARRGARATCAPERAGRRLPTHPASLPERQRVLSADGGAVQQ